MKEGEITCSCGKSHQINRGESVTCECGAVLTIQPLHQKVGSVWKKFYQPVASVDDPEGKKPPELKFKGKTQ